MSKEPAPATIDAYLAPLSPEVREILETVRRIVKEEMPAFKVERIFFYFAAFKKHLGIYPPVNGGDALQRDLAPYLGPKNNLKFPFTQPISYELIRRVVRSLADQYARR
jgi:uncharacterized protein YdhG (YjbR/CyaY superfamily)